VRILWISGCTQQRFRLHGDILSTVLGGAEPSVLQIGVAGQDRFQGGVGLASAEVAGRVPLLKGFGQSWAMFKRGSIRLGGENGAHSAGAPILKPVSAGEVNCMRERQQAGCDAGQAESARARVSIEPV
jgi:hypothetical protein